MNESIIYIGGADGPTSIFLAESEGFSFINILGLCIVVLMMLPNIIYSLKFRDVKNHCHNRLINILEQVGRYGSMLFMVLNVGLTEFGFASAEAFLCYLFINAILIISYWVVWITYFKKQTLTRSLVLAIIPTCIFLLCGILLRHWLLLGTAVLFGVGHITVTFINNKSGE